MELRSCQEAVLWGNDAADRYDVETSTHQGGDWLRLWSSKLEKRAVVSGATLKSRNKKQTRTINSR